MFSFLAITYAIIISCFCLSLYFSEILYKKEIKKSYQQIHELSLYEEGKRFPCMGLIMASMVAVIYAGTNDIILASFLFVLAITAYTDLSTRWIPDLCIYALLAISVYSLTGKEVMPAIVAVVFFVMPAILLNFYGYIKKGETWIAAGDFHVFPTVGLMTKPEYAAGLMLATLIISLFLMKKRKNVPLITVLYFTFSWSHIWFLN